MDILGHKDPSLRTLLTELSERLPANSFVVVDSWDDPFAIGLAAPSHPDHLVYITSDRDVRGRYFLSRELPSSNDLDPFRDGGANWFASVDSLARAIADHLSAA